MGWAQKRKKVAEKIADALFLCDDLVISEVRTSDSKVQAIARLNRIISDVETALEIVMAVR